MDFTVFDKNGDPKDYAWLQETFNVEFKDAGDGPKFKLVEVRVTEGPAVFMVTAKNEDGQPQTEQPVAFSWQQVGELDNAVDLRNKGLKSLWHTHALVQDTNANGDTGFGFGGGSVIKEHGGPHTLWVLSPSLPSDALAKVGWLGGTDHIGPNRLTFQIVNNFTSPFTPPPISPPSVEDELRELVRLVDEQQQALDAIKARLQQLEERVG